MEVLPYKIFSNKKFLENKNIHIKPKVSLFVAFYNNVNFFDLVFASIEFQTFKDFELVICDDGSKSDVVQHLLAKMKNTNVLVKHIWHEDKGFRKNEMLNKAILNCEGDYIIFVDQDCVLHPEFIHEHYINRDSKKILAGRRLEFSPFVTKLLTIENIKNGFIQKNLWWILPVISLRKDNQGLKGVYIQNPVLRKFMNRKKRGVVGCNFSVHKSDLLAVNGFDMRYQGPGTGEDSDIEYRLNLYGVETLPFCHAAVQYHLFHPLQKRKNENEVLFAQIQKTQAKITPCGTNLISKMDFTEL